MYNRIKTLAPGEEWIYFPDSWQNPFEATISLRSVNGSDVTTDVGTAPVVTATNVPMDTVLAWISAGKTANKSPFVAFLPDSYDDHDWTTGAYMQNISKPVTAWRVINDGANTTNIVVAWAQS
jgi:hypothetical protein